MAVELGEFFHVPQKEVWLQEFVVEKWEGGFRCLRPCRGPVGTAQGLSSGMEDGLEPVRDKPRLRLWGRRDVVRHLVLVGSPGREPCVPSAHRLLCFCKAPPPRPRRLIFLLVLLTPQARPPSSKALAGRVLTLLSEASFPRPRGPHISPLSTGRCPPAESSRSCTGRWPPSTARTGEAPPLAAGPVCPIPICGQPSGRQLWGAGSGLDSMLCCPRLGIPSF